MTLLKTLLATALVAASLVSAHAQDRTIKFAFQNQTPSPGPGRKVCRPGGRPEVAADPGQAVPRRHARR